MTFGDSVKIKVPLQTIKKSRLKKRGTPLDPRYLGIRRILYRKPKNTIQKSGLYNFNQCTYSQPLEFNLKNFSELCGPTTNFSGIEHGYGLFPDSSIRKRHPECGSWGEIEYKSGDIRTKYFV